MPAFDGIRSKRERPGRLSSTSKTCERTAGEYEFHSANSHWRFSRLPCRPRASAAANCSAAEFAESVDCPGLADVGRRRRLRRPRQSIMARRSASAGVCSSASDRRTWEKIRSEPLTRSRRGQLFQTTFAGREHARRQRSLKRRNALVCGSASDDVIEERVNWLHRRQLRLPFAQQVERQVVLRLAAASAAICRREYRADISPITELSTAATRYSSLACRMASRPKAAAEVADRAIDPATVPTA